MAAARYRLVIGNKAWSSWSLRPWLVLKHFGLDFEEVGVKLRLPDSKARIMAHSPAGKVPALLAGDLLIWDSLAIIEYLADRHPDKAIWPKSVDARAVARAASAEMHSGFQALREHCPMDILAVAPKSEINETAELNIRRIVDLWREVRQRFGADGPFLFSDFSAADAMYAPVASRFRTYVPDLKRYGDDGAAQAYVDTIFALPEIAEWSRGAAEELKEDATAAS